MVTFFLFTVELGPMLVLEKCHKSLFAKSIVNFADWLVIFCKLDLLYIHQYKGDIDF
jgi:hypothetical protein